MDQLEPVLDLKDHRSTQKFIFHLKLFESLGQDYDPESLILVDYDNTAYGFRIFDLLYFTSNMNYNWTEEDINEMLEEYVTKQDRLKNQDR